MPHARAWAFASATIWSHWAMDSLEIHASYGRGTVLGALYACEIASAARASYLETCVPSCEWPKRFDPFDGFAFFVSCGGMGPKATAVGSSAPMSIVRRPLGALLEAWARLALWHGSKIDSLKAMGGETPMSAAVKSVAKPSCSVLSLEQKMACRSLGEGESHRARAVGHVALAGSVMVHFSGPFSNGLSVPTSCGRPASADSVTMRAALLSWAAAGSDWWAREMVSSTAGPPWCVRVVLGAAKSLSGAQCRGQRG